MKIVIYYMIVFATVCFGLGIYLIPATMWRSFCVAFLMIAVILLAVGIILIRKKKNNIFETGADSSL